jgi:hypothetical protein
MAKYEYQLKHCFQVLPLVALLLVALSFATVGTAQAHSFTVALNVVGDDQPTVLASAIRGMRLAATERDGHADETSDGHLGGLDLFILPRPEGVPHGIAWLKGAPPGEPDIIVIIGPSDAVATEIQASRTETVAIGSGVVPDDTPPVFAERFRAAYGIAPDRQAAEGYNAARRIDLAVRAQAGVADREKLAVALASTVNGIDW